MPLSGARKITVYKIQKPGMQINIPGFVILFVLQYYSDESLF